MHLREGAPHIPWAALEIHIALPLLCHYVVVILLSIWIFFSIHNYSKSVVLTQTFVSPMNFFSMASGEILLRDKSTHLLL